MAKRRHLGGVILCLALIAPPVTADLPTTVVIGTLPQPAWSQLSTQQKIILAPLANDWETIENVRKKKWLGIADRYPSMKPDEQLRTQERMREWARLTPEQRAKVRDSYKDFNQLPPEQKTAVKKKWEAYSNLPQEEKQRVREGGKSAKLLTPPSPPPAPLESSPSEVSTDSANITPQAPPVEATRN